MSQLSLRYEYDPSFFDPALTPDDFGRLSISVQTDRFTGRGGFWVQWQDVKDFGEALASYPIEEGSPVVGQWGYEMQEGDDLILRVAIAPSDKRGNLVVRFEVADEDEPQCRVRGSFLTNYPEVDAFRLSIAKLLSSEAEEAVLSGR